MHIKGNSQQGEKPAYEMGENICKSYISDKWLISKIHKELQQQQKTKNQNRYFSKDIHGQQAYEKMQLSLIIGEKEIKIPMRYCFTLIRMVKTTK